MKGRVVTQGFHERVFARVREVPAGFVTTYGDVATALGSPRVARHVGWALAALTDEATPWHRVINSRGKISFPADSERGALQRQLLEWENIQFRGDIVVLRTHRWAFAPPDLQTG